MYGTGAGDGASLGADHCVHVRTFAPQIRNILMSYPMVTEVGSELARPDDGTDIEGYENTEYFVPLRARKDWPLLVEEPSSWKHRS